MNDHTKLSNIRIGMTVRIKIVNDASESEGQVFKVFSKNDDPDGILVLLEGGRIGNVIKIINSPEIIKKRILSETQNSENKSNFYQPVMQNEVIPKTIQSFLNADGGYLYIGVKDDAPPEEKIIGLDEDRKTLEERYGKLSDDKFSDKFRSDVEKTLDKFLASDASFGSLLDFDFPVIDGKMLLQIDVKRSPAPVFYKCLNRNNKETVFEICLNGNEVTRRRLDEFHYRDGSRKRHCETFEEYHEYHNQHFQNS